jgi:(p)ppGpp synthase/HD superfamily hydrolase
MNKIREAIEYARSAHEGQTRKDGSPYIVHPLRVAAIIGSLEFTAYKTEAVMAAVLHDVVEDTDVIIENIYSVFGTIVGDYVDILTHKKGDSYFHYVLNIAKTGGVPLAIKYADIYDNWNDDSTEESKRKYIDAEDLFYIAHPISFVNMMDEIGELE